MIEVKELIDESQEVETIDLELFDDPYLDFEYKEAPELSDFQEILGVESYAFM